MQSSCCEEGVWGIWPMVSCLRVPAWPFPMLLISDLCQVFSFFQLCLNQMFLSNHTDVLFHHCYWKPTNDSLICYILRSLSVFPTCNCSTPFPNCKSCLLIFVELLPKLPSSLSPSAVSQPFLSLFVASATYFLSVCMLLCLLMHVPACLVVGMVLG